MRAAVAARRGPVVHDPRAAAALVVAHAGVLGPEAREDGHGELVVGLVLLRRHVQGLELDERARALAVELCVEGGEGHETVDLLGVEHALVLLKPQRRAHGHVHVALVELALSEAEEVVGLRAAPGRVERLVRAGGGVVAHEARESLRRVVRAGGDHGVQGLPAEGVHLQGGKHVELLDAQWGRPRVPGFLGKPGEEACGVRGLTRLVVELHGGHYLLLRQEVLGILGDDLLDLRQLVLLCQGHRRGPLVEVYARLDRRLHVPGLGEGRCRLVREADGDELVADLLEQRRGLGEGVNELLQSHVVLERVVAAHESPGILGLRVVLSRLGGPLALRIVVADGVVGGGEQGVVAPAALLYELDHAEPVPEARAQVQRQVTPVHGHVDLLRLLEAAVEGVHLRLLQLGVTQQLEALDRVDGEVVGAVHEGLLCHGEVPGPQRRVRQQAPEPGVGPVLHEGIRLMQGHFVEELARVPQALGVEAQDEVLARGLRVRDQLVQEHGGDLQVREGAQVGGGEHGLLRLQAPEDVHARLLHHGEELGVVGRPLEVPGVLALEGQLLAPVPRLRVALEGVHAQHAVGIDVGEARRVTVHLHAVRPRAELVPLLEGHVRQRALEQRPGLAGDEDSAV
mmetsp:Transcript_25550/g.75023  ORF Transcript_25550/g.75023 Transcript_25550/m.75023 type:complete len:627 (+) Transcript_25550:373-2253(+)